MLRNVLLGISCDLRSKGNDDTCLPVHGVSLSSVHPYFVYCTGATASATRAVSWARGLATAAWVVAGLASHHDQDCMPEDGRLRVNVAFHLLWIRAFMKRNDKLFPLLQFFSLPNLWFPDIPSFLCV